MQYSSVWNKIIKTSFLISPYVNSVHDYYYDLNILLMNVMEHGRNVTISEENSPSLQPYYYAKTFRLYISSLITLTVRVHLRHLQQVVPKPQPPILPLKSYVDATF